MNQNSKSTFYKRMKIRKIDVLFNIWAICAYIYDFGADINLTIKYYNAGDIIYSQLTVLFIVAPAITMAIFSLCWYLSDEKKKKLCPGERKETSTIQWILRALFSFLFMAPVLRYYESLFYAWKSWRSDTQKDKQDFARESTFQRTDAAFLQLCEAFLETGPQVILVIYIFAQRHLLQSVPYSEIEIAQLISLVSLISMSSSISTYASALRQSLDDKKDLKFPVTLVVIAWKIFDITSRAIALGLFASVFPKVFWCVCSAHFFVMFLWVRSLHTDFCDTKFGEFLYNIVLAIMSTFVLFNSGKGKTLKSYIWFYSLMFVENTVLMSVWYLYTPDTSLKLPIMIAQFVLFYLNIALMISYYYCLHPNRGICKQPVKEKDVIEIKNVDDKSCLMLQELEKITKEPGQMYEKLPTESNDSEDMVKKNGCSVLFKENGEITDESGQKSNCGIA